MSLVATGLEIVSIERLRGALERHGERLRERLFTPAEIADSAVRADPLPALAARLAAKLALRRALRDPTSPTSVALGLRDIEVVSRGRSVPWVRLQGQAARRCKGLAISLSLSHDGGVALASVIVERPDLDLDPDSDGGGSSRGHTG